MDGTERRRTERDLVIGAPRPSSGRPDTTRRTAMSFPSIRLSRRRRPGRHVVPWTARRAFEVIAPSGARLGMAEVIVTGEDVIVTYGHHTVGVAPRRRFQLWLHEEHESLYAGGAGWHKDGAHGLELSINSATRVRLPVRLTTELHKNI